MTDNKNPTLSVDVAYYQQFLDDDSITEEQKRELIETLWSVVIEFVQMGWGIHPVQQVLNEDNHHKSNKEGTVLDADMVQSITASTEKNTKKEGAPA